MKCSMVARKKGISGVRGMFETACMGKGDTMETTSAEEFKRN